MPKVTTRTRIEILRRTHHRIIDVHERKVSATAGLIAGPIWLRRPRVGDGVGIEMCDEAVVIIFHDISESGIVAGHVCSAISVCFRCWKVNERSLTAILEAEQKRLRRAVHLRTGVEDHFVGLMVV